MSFGQQPPGGFYGPPGGAPPGGGPPGGFGGPPAGPPGGFGGPPAGPPGGYGGPPGGYGGPPGGFGAPPGGYVPPPGYGSPAPGVPPPNFAAGGGATDPLATTSLVLGIISLPLHFCCYLGWPVGIAAIVCGIIAVARSGKEPQRYSGKGLAWGGMISAGLGFLMIILVFVLYGAAIMLSAP